MTGKVPRKPRLVGGVKGHNMNDISFPGSPVLWTGSFTLGIVKKQRTRNRLYYGIDRDSPFFKPLRDICGVIS